MRRDITIPDTRLHHIGIAAADFETGTAMYRALGYRPITGVIEDPAQQVFVQFWQLAGEVPLEIIVPATETSPVSNFLRKTGGGLYHLCFATGDLEASLEFVRDHRGLVVRPPVPAVAFGGSRIAFVYWHHNLVEFVENPAALTGREQREAGGEP